MFKRNGRIGAAIFLGALVLLQTGTAQETAEPNGAPSSEQTWIDDNLPEILPAPSTDLHFWENQNPATETDYSRNEQIDRDSLAAQQGMRDAAWAMFWVVIAQTILILIGTVAILFTLHLTRQATTAAQQAADAARSANNTTRDVAARQGRCYIEPIGAKYEPSNKETATLLTDHANIKIKCINHGSSIGTDVICRYEVECIDLDGETKGTLRWREFSPAHQTHHRNVAPSAECIHPPRAAA